MKIVVSEITESSKEVRFKEDIDELNQLYKNDEVRDFRFPSPLDVNLVYYRSGRELFFQGWFGGIVEGYCGRCLKSYCFSLEKNFDFVLTPSPFSGENRELSRDEMGLSFYAADEINLSPYIREQMLLALPMRPLCKDACRGLCVGCGVDLNEEACRCPAPEGDPRMAPFRSLKLGR